MNTQWEIPLPSNLNNCGRKILWVVMDIVILISLRSYTLFSVEYFMLESRRSENNRPNPFRKIFLDPRIYKCKTFCHVKGRGYNTVFIISTALDVTEGIFAVLYVSIMGLTSCYKTTVFLHLFIVFIRAGTSRVLP